MEKGQVLFLNEKEIEKLLTKEDALDAVEKVLQDQARGNVVNPVKLNLQLYPDVNGYINSMPSYNKATGGTGVKVVSVYLENPRKYGLMSTMGTIVLHDWQTGMPYAIMGGTHITNLRTGAAAGLKAKYLARRDAKVLVLVGAGVQGFSAMTMALTAMGPGTIEEVVVCDLTMERCLQFIEKAKENFPGIRFAAGTDCTAEMGRADVALFCSGAGVPLLQDCPLKQGVTVICVQELVTRKTVAKFDKFYTDFTDCVLERFNSFGHQYGAKNGWDYEDLTAELVTSEVGCVMAGLIPGRVSDTENILTLDCGMSIEDVAVAQLAYERALKQGAGVVLDFQNL